MADANAKYFKINFYECVDVHRCASEESIMSVRYTDLKICPSGTVWHHLAEPRIAKL